MKKRVLSVILAFGIIFSNSSVPFATIAEDGTPEATSSEASTNEDQIPNTGDPQDEEPTQIDDDQPEDKPGDDPEPSQPDQAVTLEVGLTEFDVYKGQKDVYIENGHIKADYITVTGDGVNDELKQQIAETITADMDDSQLSISPVMPGSEEISFNGRTYHLSYSFTETAIAVKPYVVDVSVYSVNNNRVLINDNEKGRFCISNDPNSFDVNKKEIGLKELNEHKFYLKNIKTDDSEFNAISEPLLAYEIDNFCKDGIRIDKKDNNVYCGNDRIAATNQNVKFLTSISIKEYEGDNLYLLLYYEDANGEQSVLERIRGEKQANNSAYTFNVDFKAGEGESQVYKILHAELYIGEVCVGSTKAKNERLEFKDSRDSGFDTLIVDKIPPVIKDIEWDPKEKKAYITVEEKESGITEKQHYVTEIGGLKDDYGSYVDEKKRVYSENGNKWIIDFGELISRQLGNNYNGPFKFYVKVIDAAKNETEAFSEDYKNAKGGQYDGKDPTVKITGVYFDESGDGETPNWKAVTSLNAYQYGIYANKPMKIEVKAFDNDDEDSAINSIEFLYGDNHQHKIAGTRVYKTVTEEGSDTSKEVPTNRYNLVLQNGHYQDVSILAYDDMRNYNGKNDPAKRSKLFDLLKEYYEDFPDCPSDLYIESDPAAVNITPPEATQTNGGKVWYGEASKDGVFNITISDYQSGIRSVEVLDNNVKMNEASKTFDTLQQQDTITIKVGDFAEGEHTLAVKVTDNAGNVNTYTQDGETLYSNMTVTDHKNMTGFNFYTDFTAPTGTLTFNEKSEAAKVMIDEDAWFNGCSVDATADLVGFLANVNSKETSPWMIEYTITNEDGRKWEGKKDLVNADNETIAAAFDETGVSVSQDKAHKLTVSVTFIDLAGNESEPVTLTYFKDTQIPTINSVSVSKAEEAADQILRILTFGIYSNYHVRYAVEASDAANDSGLSKSSVQITFGSTSYLTTQEEENGRIIYTKVLNADDEGVLSGEVGVTVTDRYGLGSTQKIHYNKDFQTIEGTHDGPYATIGLDQTASKQYMIERNLPKITFEPLVSDGVERSDGQIWFKDDHDISFTAEDADSGISSVKVFINNSEQPQTNDSDKKAFLTEEVTGSFQSVDDVVKKDTYRLSTDSLIAELREHVPQDGHYVITVEVEDYAGNKAKDQIEYNIDKQAPNIENISFSLKSADGYGNTDEYQAEEKFIEYLEYGYYFREAFTATVHVTDEAPSSGLYEVKYTFIPYQNGEKGEEYGGTASIDANGNASFDVAKDYKGQIRVMASDYVGNESVEKNPHAFVVDSMDVHEAETHIEISGLDGTSFKDQAQHPLYDRDVNLTVKIIDKQSGIREIKYSMKSEQENQDEKVITIANTDVSMDQDLGDGWKVTAMDANLVTEVTREYHFTSDNNDMQLLFAMTDRANNSSSRDSDVFSIDKTAPVIDVVFAPTPGSGTYYREARTATITVTERNFDASRINATIETVGGTVPTLSFKDNSNTEHVAELTFLEGDYTFSIDGTDLCNHNATVKYSGGNEQKFTVDLTDPIETDNFDQFKNNRDNSFNVNKEMTFTVTEHNFVPEAVNIHIYRVPAGEEFTASGRKDCTEEYLSKSKWTDTGDSHTISFTFSEDYVYQVSINASDAAGRTLAEKTSPVFEIDKTAPVLKTPTDLEKIAYTAKDKASSAKPIQFEDKNLVGVKYTVVSYRMKRNEDQVGYDMDITSKDHDTKTDSVVLDKDYFAQDGIYEVMCTAYDVAGNVSKKSTHTFIIQRDSDFLVYIPESDKEAHTGLYEFNERGVRSAEFKDINIVAYLAKEKNFEVQVDGTTVTEPDVETEVQDELINQVNVYDVTLRNSFISNNYNSEEIDTDLMLNAVATGEGKEQVITLGHIYIDNVKPAGEYESALQNLGFFDGFYGMDSRIATLEGVSPDIDVDKCEIMLNDATLKSEDGGFTYDENAHTITFRLNRGFNDIRPTLVDMAGNVNTLDVVKNVYVGGVFARWWFLFILGGLVVAAIPTVLIILAIRKKKYSV